MKKNTGEVGECYEFQIAPYTDYMNWAEFVAHLDAETAKATDIKLRQTQWLSSGSILIRLGLAT